MDNKRLENEQVLLDQITIGGQKAFAIVFTHYSKFVYSFAFKLTRSDSLAEEIVQEVFLKIWVHRGDIGNIENFGAYLNRITRNQAYNVLRKISYETLISAELSKQAPTEANDTEKEINFKEAGKTLNRAIENLTPQQKIVYTLCHQEGLKYSEVADRLNISTSTVHSHMKQALHTIRTYFLRLSPILFYFFFRLF